jgi:hypothetical protein
MQDPAVVSMWQDIMAAFAARYNGDTRIASMLLDEVYPSLWQRQDLCGNFGGLDDAKAANAGLISIMKAYLDVDPDVLWAIVNWFPSQTPVISTWENGYGGNTLGANDLPGVQGHYRQDPKFFQGNAGSGNECAVDTDEDAIWMNDYLIQYYGVNGLAPIFTADEANGWYMDSYTNRTGSSNPWNAAVWPQDGESLPNDDGNQMPSARFWTWYYSGAPKATGASADSRLGQDGTDPCGVVPANFYCMEVPTWNRQDRPTWTSANLSLENWLAAFSTFGPNGTQAMFAHPEGYLQQFSEIRPPGKAAQNQTWFQVFINGSIARFVFPLTLKQDVMLQVYDLSGRMIRHKRVRAGEKETILLWSDNGVYVASINDGTQKHEKRIVIVH